MKKKIISLLTALIMVVGLVGVMPTVSVGAAESKIETALTWAINIANDNSHGYSQSNRWGPDYDCSSFVISALKYAGFNVGSATYTGNMKSQLIKNGFTWIPWSSIGNQSNLQRGDILLNEATHTEFYLGNGKNVGAHSNRGYPQTGDQTGTEVSVSGYYYHPWDGVLRYEDLTSSTPSMPSNKIDIGTDFSAKIIHSSSGKVLTDNSSDVALYDDDKTRLSSQIWKFHRNSDGSYTIKSSYNDKVFDLDNFKDTDCTNIHLYYSGNTSNQKWYIYKLDDGSFVFQPTCSTTRVLDLANGSTNNGTTAWLYTYNGSAAQKFNILNCDEIVNFGDEQVGCIMNLSSWKPIMQQDDNNVVLGKEKVVNMNRTSWHMYRNADDGSYTIYNYLNGYVLSVDGSKDADCANVICQKYENCSTNARKWWFLSRPDGTTYLKSACSVRALDLLDGNTSDGTNVQMYSLNGTPAQTFVLYPYDAQRDKISYTIKSEKTSCEVNEKVKVTILNCTYAISYKIHIIDPSGKETIIDNGCNDIYTFVGDKIGDYIIFAEVVSPVSNDKGSTTSKCVTINVSCTHNYTSTITTPATCTSAGVKTYTCSICGDSYTETIPKTTHMYDSGKITTVATCTTDGIKTYTCTVCGSTKIETIPKTGHNIVIDKAIAPTDTQSGKTEGSHCSVCGEIIKEQEIIPKLGHDYNISSTTPATCTTDGIIIYTCSTCGDTYSETIPVTGHKSVTDKAQMATCEVDGKTEGSHCSVCGEIIKEQEIIPKLGHDYNISSTTPATCTTDGVITYTCSVCGDTYTEIIPVTGHNYIEEVITPTEKEQGYTLHTCTICGDSYKDNYTDYKPIIDVTLEQIDINGDGKISTADVGLINAHAKGTKLLSDEALEKADVNNDGKITTADVGLINAYAKGTKEYA